MVPTTGSAYLDGKSWRAKIGLRGKRPSFGLPTCKTRDEARRRARVLAELAASIPATMDALTILREVAALPEADLHQALEDLKRAIKRHDGTKGMTVEQLGKAWTSGEISKRYPDHVKRLADSGNVSGDLESYVYPIIGAVPVSDVDLAHLDRVASNLPSRLSSGTRSKILRMLSRLVRVAVYPMRLLPHDPIPRGWAPTARPGVFPYLYPQEEAALLGCVAVPLERRMLYGLTAREGLRKGEALGLRWSDLDLERGTVSLTKTKTDDPRTWKLGDDTLAALRIWRGMVKGATVFSFPREVDQHLRPDLLTAGVTRKDLHNPQSPRKPLRFHDLRATFVTLALAVGRPERWVMARTGHTTSGMLSRYHRQARLAEELDQGWFRSMVDSIPEFRGKDSAGNGQESGEVSDGKPDSGEKERDSKGLEKQHRSTASTGLPHKPAEIRSISIEADAKSGVFEAAGHLNGHLQEAIVYAAKAGQWDVVRSLVAMMGDSSLAITRGSNRGLETSSSERKNNGQNN